MTGKGVILRGLAASYELFMLAPLWLYMYFQWGSGHLSWPWLAAGGAAAVAGGAFMPRFNVLWKQAAAALLLFAVAFGASVAVGQPPGSAFAGPLLLSAGWLQGVTAPSRYRTGWYWTGVAVYFAASVVVNFQSFDRNYGMLLTAGGVVCLAAALYAAGSGTLRDIAFAADNPRRVPRDLKRMGALYVTFIWAAMIAMGAGLSSLLWQALKGFLRWLFGQSGGTAPPAPSPEPQRSPSLQEMLPPAGEPGLLARILDVLFHVVSIVLLTALLLWGIYLVYRHYGRIWRRFLERLTALLQSGSASRRQAAGFTDEETSLFSWEETLSRIRRNRLGRLLTGYRIPRYEDMPDNRTRARFLYRKWLESAKASGYPVRPELTPLETLADFDRWQQSQDRPVKLPPAPETDPLIRLYNRVRYRQDDPTDEQLRAIRDKMGTR